MCYVISRIRLGQNGNLYVKPTKSLPKTVEEANLKLNCIV